MKNGPSLPFYFHSSPHDPGGLKHNDELAFGTIHLHALQDLREVVLFFFLACRLHILELREGDVHGRNAAELVRLERPRARRATRLRFNIKKIIINIKKK